MSSRRADGDRYTNKSIDYLIRCALQDTVAFAEPSPEVWQRIHEQVRDGAGAGTRRGPVRFRPFLQRLWQSWFFRVGAPFTVSDDSRPAYQQRLHGFDRRLPLSVSCMIESRVLVLRLFS